MLPKCARSERKFLAAARATLARVPTYSESLFAGYGSTPDKSMRRFAPRSGARLLSIAAVLGAAAFGSVSAAAPEALAASAPMTEELAVDLALKHSPTLEVARRELNVGLIQADRTRPAFRPDVQAVAAQGLREPRVDLPGRPDKVVLPNASSRLSIELRQPLYQFGAGNAPLQRSTAMADAARSSYRKAELDLSLQVREAYLAAALAQSLSVVARQGLELAREHVRVTRLLRDQGMQADVDVLQAERGEAEAEAAEIQARNGAALSLGNLNRTLSRPLAEEAGARLPETLPADPESLEPLKQRAMIQRPELTLLDHQIQAAAAGIRLARSSGQPRISLEASYSLQTETALAPFSGISAAVSITAPLFDGAARGRTVREAEERLAQLRAQRTVLEQAISLELEQQRLAHLEARGRVLAAERAILAADKAYEIQRLRLERGRAVQVEVLDARTSLMRVRGDRERALHDGHLARVRLQRALGEGLPSPR